MGSWESISGDMDDFLSFTIDRTTNGAKTLPFEISFFFPNTPKKAIWRSKTQDPTRWVSLVGQQSGELFGE